MKDAEFGSFRTSRAATGLDNIALADRRTLAIIAKELDLPKDDGESIGWLIDACKRAAAEIRAQSAEDRAQRLRTGANP